MRHDPTMIVERMLVQKDGKTAYDDASDSVILTISVQVREGNVPRGAIKAVFAMPELGRRTRVSSSGGINRERASGSMGRGRPAGAGGRAEEGRAAGGRGAKGHEGAGRAAGSAGAGWTAGE